MDDALGDPDASKKLLPKFALKLKKLPGLMLKVKEKVINR